MESKPPMCNMKQKDYLVSCSKFWPRLEYFVYVKKLIGIPDILLSSHNLRHLLGLPQGLLIVGCAQKPPERFINTKELKTLLWDLSGLLTLSPMLFNRSALTDINYTKSCRAMNTWISVSSQQKIAWQSHIVVLLSSSSSSSEMHLALIGSIHMTELVIRKRVLLCAQLLHYVTCKC